MLLCTLTATLLGSALLGILRTGEGLLRAGQNL